MVKTAPLYYFTSYVLPITPALRIRQSAEIDGLHFTKLSIALCPLSIDLGSVPMELIIQISLINNKAVVPMGLLFNPSVFT